MKKCKYCFIISVIFCVLFLNACNSQKAQSENDEIMPNFTELQTILESADSLPVQDPFQVREFSPYIEDRWIGNAVAYGYYRKGQAPGQQGPSNEELLEDLHIIKEHWNLIRVYGAGNDTKKMLEQIKQHDLPIKVMLGIWLESEENNPEKKIANINQTINGIKLAHQFKDIVNSIAVGNETGVFWSGHRMKPDNVIKYIRFIRENVTQPITTADDYNFWNKKESEPIADELDFIVTHMHPLWNGKKIDEAISWVDSIYTDIKKLHPEKLIVIGETGWATKYDKDKIGDGQQGTLIKGKADIPTQAVFFSQYNEWVNKNKICSFWFEVFDESWKGSDEPNEVEKHWGLYFEDRTQKHPF